MKPTNNDSISIKKICNLKFVMVITFLFGTVTSSHSQNPQASFSSNVASGCASLTVRFIDDASNVDRYRWDFGNGAESML